MVSGAGSIFPFLIRQAEVVSIPSAVAITRSGTRARSLYFWSGLIFLMAPLYPFSAWASREKILLDMQPNRGYKLTIKPRCGDRVAGASAATRMGEPGAGRGETISSLPPA